MTNTARCINRMAVIVSQIILNHISFFNQHWASATVRHIKHQHSSTSVAKSEMVITRLLSQLSSSM